MKSKIAFLLIIAFASAAEADNRGVSPYAIFHPKWNCSQMLWAYNNLDEIKASVLWGTFGDKLDCYNKMVSSPKFKAIEVHLLNGPCQNNNRCGSYEFKFDPKHPEKFEAYAAMAYSKLISKLRPGVKCYVSAKLETKDSPQIRKQMADIAYRAFNARCTAVDNPVGNSPYPKQPVPGTILELHGGKPAGIYNNDGTIYSTSEAMGVLAAQSQAGMALYWTIGDNCNEGVSGFVDPRKRTGCKKNFSDVIKVVTANVKPPPAGEVPNVSGCKKVLSTHDGDKRGFVFKNMDAIPPGQHRMCGRKITDGAVALLPSEFKNSRKLVLKGTRGELVTSFCFAGLRTEDNTNRPMYRCNVTPDKLPYNVTLRDEFGNCFPMENPKVRND